jgi:hypothetical protein
MAEDIWNLMFFFSNVLICVLGYRFKYDSSGTGNPGWTAVFG